MYVGRGWQSELLLMLASFLDSSQHSGVLTLGGESWSWHTHPTPTVTRSQTVRSSSLGASSKVFILLSCPERDTKRQKRGTGEAGHRQA